MFWKADACRPVLLPLESVGSDFPGGFIGGDPDLSDLELETRDAKSNEP
jgi:hypothetical protein